MSKVGLTERYDLQHMIKNSPDAFFQEMGESLLLLGDEVRPTDFVEDRIDLLAVDQQNWDDALKAIANKAIVEFYKKELDSVRENHLGKRILFYRIAGCRRFFMAARKKAAYVLEHP